jgi:hypothetical protein
MFKINMVYFLHLHTAISEVILQTVFRGVKEPYFIYFSQIKALFIKYANFSLKKSHPVTAL